MAHQTDATRTTNGQASRVARGVATRFPQLHQLLTGAPAEKTPPGQTAGATTDGLNSRRNRQDMVALFAERHNKAGSPPTLVSVDRAARSAMKPPNAQDRLEAWLQRGRVERFVVETEIAPDLALLLLERNIENRPLHWPTVENYAAAMRRGEWRLNGQNIIIADTGELNDGQTRLNAIIEAGVAVPIGLQFGVTRESRATLDVGRKRSLGDHLSMAGRPNANLLAAALRLAWNYDSGIYSLSMSPTVEQAFDYLRANNGIEEYLGIGAKLGSAFSTSGAQFAFAGYVCGRVNRDVARELLERVSDGLGLSSAGLPAARVRERLMQHLLARPTLGRNEPAAVFIKAFNAARAGRRARALSWASTGPKAEDFPIAGE